MEPQGLRDVERWKDKIEVRLDNRQVAFLFFGSALCACMLFILGVIVGKRLESRGRAMAPEIEDPLALLDRVAASTPAASATTPPATPTRPRRPSTAPAESPRIATARAPEKTLPKPVTKLAEVVPPPAKPRPAPSASAALAPTPGASEVLTEAAPGARPISKPRFMLQVGSFSVRAEADALASSFAGQNAMVVPSDVPGKGLWYRVRVGNYQTFKEAIDAKLVFEKKHNKIALVIGPL